MPTRRLAVVLLNLGGPDGPDAVRPFLTNLFTDPAIVRLPWFIRRPFGRFIAARRTKAATENYAILGGGSPLLRLTEEQGGALQAALSDDEGEEVRCFVAMRYWHPFTEAAVAAVAEWAPDEVVILPLYPQFSTTTTGSSLTEWRTVAKRAGLDVPTTALCCFHSDDGFASATAALVRTALAEARASIPPGMPLRILYSAHGLPESIIKRGDPYQWQVEQTVEAVSEALGDPAERVVCYQSRVTPQTWIGPSTEEEIRRAGAEGVALLVCPIAFVSEHSETLVELDVEYREVADHAGVPAYFRVPAQNSDGAFIGALAGLVRRARATTRGSRANLGPGGGKLCSFAGGRQCPRDRKDCPHEGLPALRPEREMA